MDGKDEDDAMFGCLLVVLGFLFVGLIVFILTVVVPDGRSQIERCEAKGGIMISGGVCTPKENVLNY